jgi:uncharacterized protein with HEPN domain
MKGKFADFVRLQHIKESIDIIVLYCADISFEEFTKNELLFWASVKLIENIGEAAVRLSVDFKKQHSNIEWKLIIGMRNMLIHEYFGIDKKIVWDVVNNDIQQLKNKIDFLTDDLKDDFNQENLF